MKNTTVEYIVYQDNVTDLYTVYAKHTKRYFFGIFSRDVYQGILFDGRGK